jgi:cyclopropane fatty-acyl-phospholipid synthase-like methyltransferase
MTEYSIINKCPISDSLVRVPYFDLGNFPLVNNLNDTREESLSCNRYPLTVSYYPESGLSALTHAVNGDLLFSNYLFKSGVNIPYIEHCEKMFEHINEIVRLSDNDTIIDIGGNDGTLLSAFKSVSDIPLKYLNIDPSRNLAELSQQKGIAVMVDFFSAKVAKTLPKVKVITSTNVFQHLLDINSFVEGINILLKDDGIWVLEFPYWIHDMVTNQFDQIYHEHVYYYSVTPLKKLFEKHGLRIVDVVKQQIHGGTLRLIITKQDSKLEERPSVEQFLLKEKDYNLEYYENWGDRISNHLNECKELLLEYKQQGKRIVGFGAAAKGCIFLNSLELDNSVIDFIIDETDIKQGKFVPGTGIQIVSRDILETEDIDIILILAHNFTDHIVNSLKYKNGFSGTFLTLLPRINIIT